ncbi:MAG TPA: hypothetical protein VGZ22_20055 [Isosphaeraceae bacterium]|jgi:hypothetical protein|nr:hypothetical protein [Isosphaeraceae bacterium]
MSRHDHGVRDGTAHCPRFCPSCREGQADGRVLCPCCGDTLIDQGYCPICEDYWRLSVGAECPKHEVELEPHVAAPTAPVRAGEPVSLVTIGTFTTSNEAEALRIRLEAEGISTFLQGERMGSNSMYNVATGGVALQVPQALAADARILLSQTWKPVTDDDLDDAWHELAPEPGVRRRLIMKALILVFLFGPVFLALLAYLMRE